MDSNVNTDSQLEYLVKAGQSTAMPVAFPAGAGSTGQDLASSDPYFTATSPGAVILVLLSFFSLVLCLPPFIWHIKNRNLAAASMVFWILLVNIFNIINPLIWSNDNIYTWWYGEGYCDVEVKLDIMATMGLVGALVCIFRSLAAALDTDRTRLFQTAPQRHRQIIIEVLYCFGLPLAIAAIHFIVQPNRYYIYAIAGCVPSYSDSWLSILLAYIWPPLICLVAGYHAIIVVIRMNRYRREFASVLSATSGMNKARFLRLMLSASILLLICLPVQLYVFAENVSYPITTWDWSRDHDPAHWQTFILVPTFGSVYSDRWIRAPLGLPVFICFGLGSDAKALYRSWLLALGLGRLFPSLAHKHNRGGRDANTSSSGSSNNSFASKARNFFSRHASRASGVLTKRSFGTDSTAVSSSATDTVHSVELSEFLSTQRDSQQKSLLPTSVSSPSHRGVMAPRPALTPGTPSAPDNSFRFTRWLRSSTTGFLRIFSKRNPGGTEAADTENDRNIDGQGSRTMGCGQTWTSSEDAMNKVRKQKEYEGAVVGALT